MTGAGRLRFDDQGRTGAGAAGDGAGNGNVARCGRYRVLLDQRPRVVTEQNITYGSFNLVCLVLGRAGLFLTIAPFASFVFIVILSGRWLGTGIV